MNNNTLTNSENIDKQLDDILAKVIDTFAFHGVTITSMDILPTGKPIFSVTINKQKMYRTLQDTLDFVYWSLWTLLFGEYSEDKKSLELILNYKEVDRNEG